MAAINYPEKIPAIVVAAGQTVDGSQLPAEINNAPFIDANSSNSISARLAALQLAFFVPNNGPHIWLEGWYPETLAMEQRALASWNGTMQDVAAGGPETQVLGIVGKDEEHIIPQNDR